MEDKEPLYKPKYLLQLSVQEKLDLIYKINQEIKTTEHFKIVNKIKQNEVHSTIIRKCMGS